MSTLKKKRHDVLVAGGGPAGMAAALFAARAGAQVMLLEPNEKLGKKLYITGKGRCNLTNMADMDETMQKITHNPRFMYAALRAFDANALRAVIEELGVPTKVERGGRVFPVSEKASDITRALERGLQAAGVTVVIREGVRAITVEDGCVVGIETTLGQMRECGALVLATGGASYPATGSTGDGYALAREVGHTVHAPHASLVPVISPAPWVRSMPGLSLKNVRLTAKAKGRTLMDEQGELLFTHEGLSGPLILTLSSHIAGLPMEGLRVTLDLKPGLDEEQLERRILRDFEENPRKQWSSLLPGLLPSSLAAQFPGLCGIAADKPVHQVAKAERKRLVTMLKALEIPISGLGGLEEAVITRGGVETKEIVPGTMASRLVKGLYFAGELIDVDAMTGGFNLQIAFSTGVCAGRGAAEAALGI